MLGPKADPQDVETIDGVMSALYESISFLPGDQPDYPRWRSLFADAARVHTGSTKSQVLTIDQYLRAFHHNLVQNGLSARGLLQQELERRGDDFGEIVNVFSQYAAWHTADDPRPFGRGVNSLQFLVKQGRWWIVNVIWDDERAEDPDYTPDYK